jgi:3-oxoacyl-[acyl-carrier protein] reductase
LDELKAAIYKLKAPPTILINNAGVWNQGKRICDLTEEQLLRVIQVNLMAPFKLVRMFLPSMIDQRYGRIVNVSSMLGLGSVARMSISCSTLLL